MSLLSDELILNLQRAIAPTMTAKEAFFQAIQDIEDDSSVNKIIQLHSDYRRARDAENQLIDQLALEAVATACMLGLKTMEPN